MLYYQNFQKRNEFILQFNSIPRQKKYDNKKIYLSLDLNT